MNRSEIMEPGMAALQDTLDAMAKDTPPVPESFRSAWRKAIRQEAAQQKEREKATLETAQPEAPRPEKGTLGNAGTRATRRNRNFSRQRGMSIAAAFVFLLGGTLIGWDTVSLVRQETEVPMVLNSKEDAGGAVMEFSANEAVGRTMKAETNGAMEAAMGAETDETTEVAMEADEAMEEANEAMVMATRAEPDQTMKPVMDAEADAAMGMVMETEVDETMGAAMETEADETMGLATADITDESMDSAPKEDIAVSAARPKRTVGFILVGLAIPLAIGAQIFRNRERHQE